jgi:tRNA uridine 5-carboxymethylaminomethyl modification enzyme
MMTSRSEYRLLLRQDNADTRLTQKGYDAGLVTKEQYDAFLSKQESISSEIERLNSTYISPNIANKLLNKLELTPISTGFSLAELLRRPQLTYEQLAEIDKNRPVLPPRVIATVEVTVKYEGYIKRQINEVERREKLEAKRLSPELDYMNIRGLRIEAAQKLSAIKPLTVGQASRISGVNPADISVLLIYLGMK